MKRPSKKKAKSVGRPKKPADEFKARRTVRVSDEDMKVIADHGFKLQSLVDMAIGSLKPMSLDEIKLSLNNLHKAIDKEGLC